jgi:hypothetical protein
VASVLNSGTSAERALGSSRRRRAVEDKKTSQQGNF